MTKKYKTTKTLMQLEPYMDTLVKFVYKKLKKDLFNGQDITYYPLFSMYRTDSSIDDMQHLDSYTLIKIILRKVTNTSSMIVIQTEDLSEEDWRYPIVTSNFKRITGTIDDSLEKYFTQKIVD